MKSRSKHLRLRLATATTTATALSLTLLCLPARSASPPETVFLIDTAHTSVYWEVLHMGTSTLRGRFDRLEGSAMFDPTARMLDTSITVDTTSVSTGSTTFDTVMRGASLLNTEAFPKAWFVARNVTFDGVQPRELRGEITLRGQSAPLTLTARRWKCGFNLLFRREVCGGDFEGSLSRSAFGMTLAAGMVGDEVRLLVQVEGIRTEPR